MTTSGDDVRLVERLAAFEQVLAALAFYADPDSYFGIAIWPDRPAGEFADDVSDDHGDDFYDRPMHGKRAREAMAAWVAAVHSDGPAGG